MTLIKYMGGDDVREFFAGESWGGTVTATPVNIIFNPANLHVIDTTLSGYSTVPSGWWNRLLQDIFFEDVTGIIPVPASLWDAEFGGEIGTPSTAPYSVANINYLIGIALTGFVGTFTVASFNARTGTVVPLTGDYTAAEVTNAADKSSTSIQVFSGDVKSPRHSATKLTASGFIGVNNGGSPGAGTYLANDWALDVSTPGIWLTPGGGVNPTDWENILAPFIVASSPLLAIYMAS